jgi:hypothetical protein
MVPEIGSSLGVHHAPGLRRGVRNHQGSGFEKATEMIEWNKAHLPVEH